MNLREIAITAAGVLTGDNVMNLRKIVITVAGVLTE